MGCSVGSLSSKENPDVKSKSLSNEQESRDRKESSSECISKTNCPLTKRQSFQIVKSWKGIARNIKDTGINMFVRMFETNTEVSKLFMSFGDIDNIAALRQNKQLEGHATMVMHVLDDAISSMDDMDYCVEMLHSVGKSHRKIPGYKSTFFQKIEEPFLLAVKETLQDRYSANMSNIYTITIHFITQELAEGFNNAPDEDRFSGMG